MVFLGQYFKRRLGLATAVALVGGSISFFISIRLVAYSIHEFGLSGTLVLTSGAAAQGIITAALFFPRISDFPKTAVKLRDLIPRNAVQSMLILSYSIGSMAMLSGPKYIPPFAKDLNISPENTSWMLSLSGIPDIIAKSFTGPICDLKFVKKRIRTYRILSGALVFLSVPCFLAPNVTSYAELFVVSTLFATGFGAFNILMPIVAADLVGPEKYGATFAAMLWGASLFQFTDIAIIG